MLPLLLFLSLSPLLLVCLIVCMFVRAHTGTYPFVYSLSYRTVRALHWVHCTHTHAYGGEDVTLVETCLCSGDARPIDGTGGRRIVSALQCTQARCPCR